MKLHELNIAKFDLVEEFDLAWDNSINEGMFDSIKDSFRKVANTFTQVYNKSNTKSGLNDVVLRAMYMEELTKLRDALSKAPSPVSSGEISGHCLRLATSEALAASTLV